MKALSVSLFLLCSMLYSGLSAQFSPFQREEGYQVMMDLTQARDHTLPVEVVTPLLEGDSAVFQLPRIIPGTYDIHDYGRFVRDLVALSAGGDTLPQRRLDHNRWRIGRAEELYKIQYRVEDTYHQEEDTDIFEPAGTAVEDSVFLLNNFGFVGYIDGRQDEPFDLHIRKPEGFYGSSALIAENPERDIDLYRLSDYFEVHDNPILYCIPDTASHMLGNTQVLVSVYSPNRVVSARESLDGITAVLEATSDYLGGYLPVDKYAVLIYTAPPAGISSYGALEHHRSTVLFMPEMSGERFYSGVADITAHEFFHIITPLNIHSERVANFDFINPEMSRHIWLYEGVTEYNSQVVQMRSGIFSLEEFLENTRDKMQTADRYNEYIPLTVASVHTLSFMKDQYYNFYQKGSNAAMALDLKLIELSEGEYRLVDLLLELGRVYGVDTFFQDDRLFDIMTEQSGYPELREFFARHIEGAEPLPLEELFEMVGILYLPEVEAERFSIGNVEFGYNFKTGRIKVEDISEMDEFGEDLGWEEGDELVEFNGMEVDLNTISEVIQAFYNNTSEGDKIKVKVARPKGEDDYKTKKLKARARTTIYMQKHLLRTMPEITPGQKRLREAWINY